MGTASYDGWLPPGQKNIDDGSLYEDHVLNFIKNTSLRFLQLVYAQRDEGEMRYVHDDEDLTEIKIADQHAFQLESSEKKPAIIGVRGSVKWQDIGMNEGLQEKDRATGKGTYTDMVTASVGFSCLSKVGPEAEKIGSEVFNLFKQFRPTLRKYGFFSIKSMNVGPEQMVTTKEGEPDLFLVSVLMTCQVQKRWTLEPESAAHLKKVILQGLAKTRGESPDEGDVFLETEIKHDDEGGS